MKASADALLNADSKKKSNLQISYSENFCYQNYLLIRINSTTLNCLACYFFDGFKIENKSSFLQLSEYVCGDLIFSKGMIFLNRESNIEICKIDNESLVTIRTIPIEHKEDCFVKTFNIYNDFLYAQNSENNITIFNIINSNCDRYDFDYSGIIYRNRLFFEKDNISHLWDLDNRFEKTTFKFSFLDLTQLEHEGRLFAMVKNEPAIKVWDVENGVELPQVYHYEGKCSPNDYNHQIRIFDDKLFALISRSFREKESSSIYVWNVEDGTVLNRFIAQHIDSFVFFHGTFIFSGIDRSSSFKFFTEKNEKKRKLESLNT